MLKIQTSKNELKSLRKDKRVLFKLDKVSSSDADKGVQKNKIQGLTFDVTE